jgi:hypothetical protein
MQCSSTTTHSEAFFRATHSEAFIEKKIQDYMASDKTQGQEDLPYYVGIVKDKQGQLKAINPQDYIIEHYADNPKSLKGCIYQVEKEPYFSTKKICNFNQIHDRYGHFAKIVLASASFLPKEDRRSTRYYAGMIAEENGNPQAALKWFRLAADDGHCVALFRLALYSKENPGELPFTHPEYLFFAKYHAPVDSEEMQMINDEINAFDVPAPANAPPAVNAAAFEH